MIETFSMNVPKVIDFDWIKTPSAQEYIDSLLHKNKRRHFGLLERPSLPPNKSLSTVRYKIFLCGKAGVGKSATVARLAGCPVSKHINETAGLETTVVYWPVRLISSGQIMFFRLHFWDIGENALKKFDHILPACKSEMDCIMFTFSFTDRSSFTEAQSLLNQIVDENDKSPVELLVGTKTDQYIQSDISERELEELSQARGIPILRSKNIVRSSPEGRESIFEVAPFMNNLCNLLFHRDCILSNSDQQKRSSKPAD